MQAKRAACQLFRRLGCLENMGEAGRGRLSRSHGRHGSRQSGVPALGALKQQNRGQPVVELSFMRPATTTISLVFSWSSIPEGLAILSKGFHHVSPMPANPGDARF